MDESGRKARRHRYLTLRSVLRFSFQHPPLLFPVVQFQRVLRSKVIGKPTYSQVLRSLTHKGSRYFLEYVAISTAV